MSAADKSKDTEIKDMNGVRLFLITTAKICSNQLTHAPWTGTFHENHAVIRALHFTEGADFNVHTCDSPGGLEQLTRILIYYIITIHISVKTIPSHFELRTISALSLALHGNMLKDNPATFTHFTASTE